MQATSKIKKGIMTQINKIILVFKDDIEIELNEIIDYDINLDYIDVSTIELTNMFLNNELLNRFKSKKNKITLIHIEYEIYDVDKKISEKVFLDIPCYMKIECCRISGDNNNIGTMHIVIDGGIQ